jgi:preprotein translocase subunit SecA
MGRSFVDGSVTELDALVAQVEGSGADLELLPDAELLRRSHDLRTRVGNGEALDAVLPTAFALVGEAADRAIGQRPVAVQIMAGAALHRGTVVEMQDGEGKTLAATLPAYLNALTGEGVHLVMLAERHAERAAESTRPIHQLLGLEVGVLRASHTSASQQAAAYAADVTYGRFGEFVNDHRRDSRTKQAGHEAQRGLRFAIVDEADHVLVDYALQPWYSSRGKDQGDTVTDMVLRSYFRLYDKLAGLTATADVAQLRAGYGLDVVKVRPRRPTRRVDHPDRPYSTLVQALPEIVSCVRARHETGQPVLVGTVSAKVARDVGRFLDEAGIDHVALDLSDPSAVDDATVQAEASSVLEQAGRLGAVTILTGDARGLDIPLGGPTPNGEHDEVVERGGLCVIGAERDRWFRRRDDRLAAWAGRRGEPGESLFIFRDDGAVSRYGLVDRMTGAGTATRRWIRAPRTAITSTERVALAQAERHARNLARSRALFDLLDLVDEQRRTWAARRRRALATDPDQVPELDRRWHEHLVRVHGIFEGLDDAPLNGLPARQRHRLVARARRHAEQSLWDISP